MNAATGALTTLGLATGIDFGALLSPGVAGAFNVQSASGDFSFLTGTSGLMKDFAFAGTGTSAFPVPSAGTPILSFQTFAAAPTLTFSLSSISTIMQNSAFLLLSGQGIFNMSGFGPTAGTFAFSGNGAQSTFSFSASQSGAQVPEPASLALLGGGLLVCAATLNRRRRRA